MAVVGCLIPLFAKIAYFYKKLFNRRNLTFVNQNMFDMDFSKFTIIYLFGTCLTNDQINLLVRKFPKKAKIITVSYPLADYDKTFAIEKSFNVVFDWGATKAYLNVRRG